MNRFLVFLSVFVFVAMSCQRSQNEDLAFQNIQACYEKALAEEESEETYEQSFSDYLTALWEIDVLMKKHHVFVLQKDVPEYEHLAGLIYGRLSWFFYNYDALDVSMECLERSNECFGKEANLKGIASNYGHMGDVMLALENRSEAVRYYRESDSIYRLLQTDNSFQFIHQSISLSSAGNKEAAKALLLRNLETTENDWMTRRTHFGLGFVYYDLQQYDSALYHYEQSYPLLPRHTIKSYSRIVQLANILGDSVKAARYGGLLAEYCFGQVSQNVQKERMITMYEEYEAVSKDKRNRDIFYFIISIVLILAIIIVFNIIWGQRSKHKHMDDIAMHEKTKALLENEIASAKYDVRRKEDKIKALEDELEKVIANPEFQKLPFEEKMATLMEMPISKRVRKVVDANVKAGVAYPELVLSDNQMNMLVNAIDAVFPKFSVRIIEKYPRLKRSDVVYCCMYIIGITEIQAAALTGKTYQAVWKRSLKLHSIFENKADLQFILHNVLRNWK